MWDTWVRSLGLERPPGERKGYPLQYSGLENSMDCIVHGVAKRQTQLSNFYFHFMLSCFSCVWLCNPIDCSPPGSSVHGILQARILEWVSIPSSRWSSRPRDWTRVVSLTSPALANRFFTTNSTWECIILIPLIYVLPYQVDLEPLVLRGSLSIYLSISLIYLSPFSSISWLSLLLIPLCLYFLLATCLPWYLKIQMETKFLYALVKGWE